MTCSGAYATAAQYEALLCAGIDLTDAGEVATVNLFLGIAASDIHAALSAIGACNCTLETWALVYLQKLNIIDAAVLQNCPCGNHLADDRKQALLEWLERQYELIRTSKIALCAGDTGSEYPAFGWAEYTTTVWNAENIIINESLKLP